MIRTRIILTGGGTAGHIWPIIAIAEVLKTNSRIKFFYVGSFNGPEKNIAKDFDIPFKRIFVGKWRNYFSISNYLDIFKTFLGIIQSFFIILFFRPTVIFAKGGYVTIPVLFWAKIFKIPVVTHESDTIMGKANRWAASFAKKICLGFPVKYYDTLKGFPIDRLIYTGTPVRKEFFQEMPVAINKPTILITGGSQGAVKINNLMLDILPELIKKYHVIHLAGDQNYQDLKDKFHDSNYELIGFSNQMPKLMRDSDLIISRAGANTLAEISALGKASILIPLPTAHLNHQTINARIYQDQNAAVVLSEKNLTSSSLLSIINRLMEDSDLRGLLGHHAREFSRSNSTEEIIDLLFEFGRNNG